MVHAYLMYGFPTQTTQETIDALEMVRQLFQTGIVQSGFWHRFAMTAHSPVGIDPAAYEVVQTGPDFGGFAENDYYHTDALGANHDDFSEGLRKSLFNYMHGMCFDFPLSEWFEVDTPKTTIAPNYIQKALEEAAKKGVKLKASTKMYWTTTLPILSPIDDAVSTLSFYSNTAEAHIEIDNFLAEWLINELAQMEVAADQPMTYKAFETSFLALGLGTMEDLLSADLWQQLCAHGLLLL